MKGRDNLERIVRLYSNDLYRILYVYCKNSSDCEDIMQSTFLKLYEADTEFESNVHIKNWLVKVAVRDALNLRKSRWTNYTELDDNISFEDEYHLEVFEALLKLKPRERMVMLLYYYQGYSVKEISAMLKLAEGSIKSVLYRGRQKLKKVLKEEDWNEE